MSRRSRRQPPSLPEQVQGRAMPAISLILFGLIVGLGGALYYAWIISPVTFTEASPARFSDEYKTDYILLVSQNFVADGDLELAQQRLSALAVPNEAQVVADLLERFVRERRPSAHIQSLAILAQNLGVEGATIALFAPTPIGGATATSTAIPSPTTANLPTATPTRSPTLTPFATIPPSPTIFPTSTSQPNYRLLDQERVCEDEPTLRLEVVTLDALLNQQPGIEVQIQWQDGTDHFVTGFNPNQGLGYGDFTMTADTSYTVSLLEGSPEISGLRIEPCDNGVPGGWRLTFQDLVLR
jgi:hypothetical protein